MVMNKKVLSILILILLFINIAIPIHSYSLFKAYLVSKYSINEEKQLLNNITGLEITYFDIVNNTRIYELDENTYVYSDGYGLYYIVPAINKKCTEIKSSSLVNKTYMYISKYFNATLLGNYYPYIIVKKTWIFGFNLSIGRKENREEHKTFILRYSISKYSLYINSYIVSSSKGYVCEALIFIPKIIKTYMIKIIEDREKINTRISNYVLEKYGVKTEDIHSNLNYLYIVDRDQAYIVPGYIAVARVNDINHYIIYGFLSSDKTLIKEIEYLKPLHLPSSEENIHRYRDKKIIHEIEDIEDIQVYSITISLIITILASSIIILYKKEFLFPNLLLSHSSLL